MSELLLLQWNFAETRVRSYERKIWKCLNNADE
jgi:hypothetical protein